MTRRKSVPWSFCRNDKGGYVFVCLRCGAEHKVETPIPVTEFVRIGNGFSDLHSACKEPTT